jgi:hypothetical protein
MSFMLAPSNPSLKNMVRAPSMTWRRFAPPSWVADSAAGIVSASIDASPWFRMAGDRRLRRALDQI